MAVTRTILPRKGLIQPQHGLTYYEADQDANWALLDANVAFISDLVSLQCQDFVSNGVVSGFTLSTSLTLTPGLTAGVLYAQATRYAPTAAPSINPAPANATSYLFYNSTTGFYYQSYAVAANLGDALIGQVTTNSNAVISVVVATRVYGQVTLTPNSPGTFSVPHLLGRVPVGAVIQMTSGGSIWFQPALMFDASNVYLVASDAGVTGKVQLW